MIKIDMVKAKDTAHDIRRAKRDEAMKPYDIKATIPHLAEAAESKRDVIRTFCNLAQVDIDAATTVDELKDALASI